MRFCASCRAEYREAFTISPDCNKELVFELPSAKPETPSEARYETWVPLAQLTSQVYASMIEELLKDREIPVVILSGTGHFGQTGQMGVSSFRPIDGTYLILTPQEFAAQADAEAKDKLGDVWGKARVERGN